MYNIFLGSPDANAHNIYFFANAHNIYFFANAHNIYFFANAHNIYFFGVGSPDANAQNQLSKLHATIRSPDANVP